MANPQKEDGYTAIANEIMEALALYRIAGEQMQCLLFIIRKTYGFNKKWDAISNSQFVKATGLKKSNVCRALNELVKKNVVIKKDNPIATTYCFNKNYKTWKRLSKKITVIKKDNKSYQKRKQQLSKKSTTKETTKETITKVYSERNKSYVLSEQLFNFILKRNPKNKKPDLQKWAVNIDLMIRRDGRIFEEIYNVIEWCQQDDFWQNNILSTKKLREKFDQLFMKMNSEISGTGKIKPSTYAQAQDAERRQRAKWLLEEMKNDKQKDSDQRVDENVPLLSHNKTHR